MADNPTGAGLNELDGVSALAKLRQDRSPKADNPEPAKTEAQPEPEEEESTEETGQSEPEEQSEGAGEGSNDTDEPAEEPERPAAEQEVALPDGKRISAKEAAEGYLRREDHTRRLMELAEHRKAIERERAEVIPKLKQFVAEQQDETPKDWVKLAKELDPWAFQQLKTEHDSKAMAKAYAKQQLDALERQQLVDAQLKAKEFLMADRTFDKSWTTEEGLVQGIQQVAAWAVKERGYDRDFLNRISEPRLIQDLEKARKWDALQKAGPKAAEKVKALPKPLKPGAKPATATVDRDLQKSKNRFHQTKTIADGQAFLSRLRQQAGAA